MTIHAEVESVVVNYWNISRSFCKHGETRPLEKTAKFDESG